MGHFRVENFERDLPPDHYIYIYIYIYIQGVQNAFGVIYVKKRGTFFLKFEALFSYMCKK